MGDYESGFDPKYGYNRNAFAHKTLGTALMGRVVKLIVTPIGLGSEAIHHLRDKKKRSESQPDAVAADATTSIAAEETRPQDNASPSEGLGDSVYVNVPENQADELIASYQAVLADGETATHELVPEQLKNDGFERDEADWALDEAASETEEKDESLAQVQSDKEEPSTETSTLGMQLGKPKADTHLKNAPLKKLPFPVILPQRRPGTKTRGFVRAYAPVLQDPGIDQEMFLRFLKNFHSAAQASPIFDIIMIATGIVGLYPDAMVGLAVQAVQIMAGIGQEVQERWRTNKFLDQANKDFFIPKGLFALIVTYKPGHSDQTEVETQTVDLGASAMAKYGDDLVAPEKTTSNEGEEREKQKRMDEMKEKMKKLRIASGETKEAEIPVTCAPLSFPALDAIADNAQKDGNTDGVANSIKAKAKSSSKFVNEYFDRRAQATYVSLAYIAFFHSLWEKTSVLTQW